MPRAEYELDGEVVGSWQLPVGLGPVARVVQGHWTAVTGVGHMPGRASTIVEDLYELANLYGSVSEAIAAVAERRPRFSAAAEAAAADLELLFCRWAPRAPPAGPRSTSS
jgi:hypothetical protein